MKAKVIFKYNHHLLVCAVQCNYTCLWVIPPDLRISWWFLKTMFCPINDQVKSKLVHKYIKKTFVFIPQLKKKKKRKIGIHFFINCSSVCFVCSLLFSVISYIICFGAIYSCRKIRVIVNWVNCELSEMRNQANTYQLEYSAHLQQ